MSRPLDRVLNVARRLILLGSVLSLFCICALAQVTSGTMFGTVKDPSGAFVSNATVTVTNPANGLTRTVTTSDSGVFVAPNLFPGTYSIQVDAPGFQKLEKRGVVLSAADRLNAGEFVLSVGTAAQSVTVTADAAQLQLQSNSGERSDLISSKQLNDVALNGRMVLDYMKLIPGVVSTFDGSSAGTGGLDTFNINGTRANQHEFTIDGASNVDTGNNGGTHVTLNTDAIAEVKVLTSNYQAEFGKAGGGQIAVATKSGTSQLHGNLRYFHRNEGLNANGWFNNHNTPKTPIPLYRYNYFGYQIGGPVIIPHTAINKNRDKVFFFWGQEYYRQLVPGGGLDEFRTPTARERQGDFSQSVDGNGTPLVIYNPATGLPFPGNKIDPTLLSPAQQTIFNNVSNVLSLYALPNITGNPVFNYATQLSYSNPRREDILRIDYQINERNRFYGRWINNAQTTTSPMQTWNLNCMGQLQLPGGCINKQPGWNLSVNLVSTIRPTLLNEVSVGPSVVRSSWTGTNGNLSVGKNNISLPMLYPVAPSTSIPDMGFSGNNNISYPWSYFGANPWFQANTTINFNDNLTWVKQNHTFKFGAFYQRSRKDQIAWGNSNGQYTFDNCATSADPNACPSDSGMAYASALLGYFRSFDQSSTRPIGFFRYNQFEFYGQDTWKVTPRFTLDYGMRFAWIPPQYDARNQIALFVPSLYDPAKAVQIAPDGSIVPNSGDPLNGMGYSNKGTLPKGGWKDRHVMPEPRIGFAYDLTNDNKTVLRGGFGTTHDREQGNLVFNTVFGNPANVVTPTVNNGNMLDIASLPQSAPGVLNGIYGADTRGKVPVVYSFSLGIQRELGWGTTLDTAYVGTLSRHQVTARDLNAIPFGTTFTRAAQDPANFGGTVPAVEPNLPPEYAAAGYSFSGQYAYPTNYLVPYKGYGNIEYYQFDGTANYHSLQVSLQRRFSKGLTFGAAYTWSKTLATASADEDWQYTQLTRALDYRPASWDRRHVVAVNYVYDLPNVTKHFGGPTWLSYITDNFQLSGITQAMTGAPLGDYPVGGSLAIWVPANQLTGSNQWGKLPPAWVGLDNNGNLILPKIGVPFTGSRGNIRGGGMQNWDMSLFKNIPLGHEQRYIQLRLEAFNVFNHPNFQDKGISANLALPTCDSTGACTPMSISKAENFGQYTSQYSGIGGPRVIQLGAKLYF